MSRCLALCLLLLPSLAWPQLVARNAQNVLSGAAATASSSAGAAGAKYGPQEASDAASDTWWAADNKLPVHLRDVLEVLVFELAALRHTAEGRAKVEAALEREFAAARAADAAAVAIVFFGKTTCWSPRSGNTSSS